MSIRRISCVLGCLAAFSVQAQSDNQAAKLYASLQNKNLEKSLSKDFSAGGPSHLVSRLITGSSYELTKTLAAPIPDIRVFSPMAEVVPEVLQQVRAPLKSEKRGFTMGANSVPQFMTSAHAEPSFDLSGRTPLVTPAAILNDWKQMWLSTASGSTLSMWGGTLSRLGNQVTYRAPHECQRGCTFSLADQPMIVAYKIPAIRKYWETYHALDLSGSTEGMNTDPFFVHIVPQSDIQGALMERQPSILSHLIRTKPPEQLDSWLTK